MPTVVRPLLAALAAAVLLTGCTQASEDSSKDFKGPQKLVANVVEDLQDAGADKDADQVCTLLTEALIAKIRATAGGKATCADAVDDALQDADAFDLDVKKITISGTTASAIVESKDNDKDVRDTLTFAKEAGRWKVSALAG